MKKATILSVVLFLGVSWITRASILHVPSDYPTIQAGIDAAVNGDTVLIADGTYSGIGNYNIDFNGKAIEVKSLNGPENCVVDCMTQGRGFNFQNGEGNNSALNGITIQNGYASDDNGGGILCMNSSSPAIVNCIVSGNSADGNGGGVACFDTSSPVFFDCIISSNSASGPFGGGGLFFVDSNITITHCIISDNAADWEGGGLFCYFSRPIITNCIISENSASKGGGVIVAFSGKSTSGERESNAENPMILNSTIVNNYAS